MNESKPAPLRVENRSERVYIFGFVRMLPLGMWLTGIVLIVYLGSYVRPHPAILISLTAIVLIVPVLLDRSTLLDPVDSVTFGEDLFVTRLAKKRAYPLGHILQIEFTSAEGNDYDDRNRSRPLCEITIRLQRSWPTRFLTTQEHAVSIANWANAHGKKIVEIDSGVLPH